MEERIGERLVHLHAMDRAQVMQVLRRQGAGDTRLFGEIAIDLGYINDEALRRAVDAIHPVGAGGAPDRVLPDVIPDMMFQLDAQGVFLTVYQPQASGVFPPPEQLTGHRVAEVAPRHVARATLRALHAVQQTGRMQEHRYALSVHGERHDFEARMAPLAEGRTFTVLRDVTGRVHRQRALQESEESLRVTVEMAGAIVVRFDAAGTITYANPFAERLFGYTAGELAGRPLFGTIVAETQTIGCDPRDMSSALLADPDRFLTNRHQVVARDGRLLWVRWNNRVIRDRRGRTVAGMSVGTDISERTRLEVWLAEHEARYQAVLGALPAVALLIRADLLLYANPHARSVLGYDAAEPTDAAPIDYIIAAQDLQTYRELVRCCESGQGHPPVEIRILRRDGQERLLAAVAVPAWVEQKPAVLMLGQDITVTRRAEDRARREVERLYGLVEIGNHYPDSVQELLDHTLEKALTLTRSRYGWIYLYNGERAELTLSACSREAGGDLQVPSPGRVYRVDESGALGEAARRRQPVMANDCHASNEPMEGDPSGLPAISRFLVVPVFSSERVVAVVAVANKSEPYEETDVLQLSLLVDSAWKMVDRRQAEDALRESRRDLNRAQSVAHIGSWRMSLPEGKLQWSDETYRIHELPPGTPVSWDSLLANVIPEDRETLRALRAAVTRDERKGLDHSIRVAGSTKWVRVEAQAEKDARGRLTGAFGTVQDITERKRLEAQLLQAQKMDVVGRLAGGMAHDFNNLLTIIGGSAEIALAALDAGQTPAGELAEIKGAVERASELTRRLLVFSRSGVAERRVIDLNVVLSDMERMLRRLIGEQIELVARMADHLPTVRIDPREVEHVLTNLAVNARDAMPEGGRLTLETVAVVLEEIGPAAPPGVAPGRYALLTVSDTGCGMSEEVQAHLFEPFFTTKEVGRGTGLGLSTCLGLVKQNGGYIQVDSKEGRGTSVKVYLPAAADPVEAGEPTGEAAVAGGDETILLVEDEAGIRSTVERFLSRYGYQVVVAADGPEALSLVERLEKPPSLLVTDVVMPGMRGPALAERLIALYPALKVLYISGYTEDLFLRVESAQIDLLSKPFSAAALAAKVREILDRDGETVSGESALPDREHPR